MTLFTVSCFPICAFAHPGDTDDDGGHYDHSTGEYHYHHGYPAHDHYDMDGDGIIDCPYNFDDKTGQNSGGSSSGGGDSYGATAPAPTEPAREVVNRNMGPIYTAVGILAVCAVVFAVRASSYKGEKKRLETMNKKINCELTRLNNLHSSDEKIISSLQAKVSRLTEVDRKCEIYKEQYDNLLEILQRKNREVDLDGKSIENPISEEELNKLRFKIEIPPHVLFGDDGLPVLLEGGSSGQYGAYTVYTSFNSQIYHADELCSGYNAQPTHLFRAIHQGKRICKRCADRLRVLDAIPEWYLDMRAFRSEIE